MKVSARTGTDHVLNRRVIAAAAAFLVFSGVFLDFLPILVLSAILTAWATVAWGGDRAATWFGRPPIQIVVWVAGIGGWLLNAVWLSRLGIGGVAAIGLTVLAVALVLGLWSTMVDTPRWIFPLAVVLWCVAAVVTVVKADIVVDVRLLQELASQELLDGRNPYAMTFPNPYSTTDTARFYAPELAVEGRLLFGFPYPPASLLMVLPMSALVGDVRLAYVVAGAATALLVAYAVPSAAARGIAVVLLLGGPWLQLTTGGWTEPLIAVLLALTVFLHVRRRSTVQTIVFGLLVAVKQYMLIIVPTYLLLLPRPWRWRDIGRNLAVAGSVTLLVTVPFVLWGVPAFWDSVVELQLRQPLRLDGASLLVESVDRFGWPPSWSYAVLLAGSAIVSLVLVLARAPTGAFGFSAGTAFVTLAWLLVSKQALGNYYSVVFAALCVAAASDSDEQHGGMTPHDV